MIGHDGMGWDMMGDVGVGRRLIDWKDRRY